MAKMVNEATGKMTRLCRKIVRIKITGSLLEHILIFPKYFRFLWDRILACSLGKEFRYRKLSRRSAYPPEEGLESGFVPEETDPDRDSDLVSLKISILGNSRIGKTSFMMKYVGDEMQTRQDMNRLNLMNKTTIVQGARISFNIWDIQGDDNKCMDDVPIVCKDAIAILFMFDLTSRCTLNSVIGWYSEARKWNKAAIPILIGTKFDEFVKLPPNLQSTIISQARTYARAMKGTLFFSSATHNINVNKIFKFIIAKLFNLPWNVERNLTIGEPIIDF